MQAVATKIHQFLRPRFRWVSDREQYNLAEHWTSHWYALRAKTDHEFADDCDGYACTAADMAIYENVPREKVRLILCETETGERHLVCGIGDYVVDNRQRNVHRWNDLPYRWIKYRQLAEVGWRSWD